MVLARCRACACRVIGPRRALARPDGGSSRVQLSAKRRQCPQAAAIKFSLASGVRNAECADSVTLSSFVSG